MNKVIIFVIKHLSLGVCLLATTSLLAQPAPTRLRVSADGHSLVKQNNTPSVRFPQYGTDGPNVVLTCHPPGGTYRPPATSTGEFYHHEPWLDFNMIQSGHALENRIQPA